TRPRVRRPPGRYVKSSAHEAPPFALDKRGQDVDGVTGGRTFVLQAAHGGCRFIDLQVAAIEQPVCFLERGDGLSVITAALQAFAIDTDWPERVARPYDVRRDILTDGAGTADHAVGTDMDELVHGREAAQDRPVADMNMTGQLNAVGHDHM